MMTFRPTDLDTVSMKVGEFLEKAAEQIEFSMAYRDKLGKAVARNVARDIRKALERVDHEL